MKQLCVWLAILLTVLSTSALSQSITVDNDFSTATYGAGASIGVPVKVSGCFALNNQFELYLSDNSGTFGSTPLKIGGYNGFFTCLINGEIPAGSAPGTYRVKIVSTNPVTTVESPAFSVSSSPISPVINLIASASNTINDTTYGKCLIFSNQNLVLQATVPAGHALSAKVLDSLGNPKTVTVTSTQMQFTMVPGNYYHVLVQIRNTSTNVISTRSFLVLSSTNNLSLQTSGASEVCYPDTKTYTINVTGNGGIKNNYPGTKYTIEWGDTTVNTYTHCELIATNGLLNHDYVHSSCGKPPITDLSPIQYNAYRVNVRADNVFCPNSFTSITTYCKVWEKPIAGFMNPLVGCINTPIYFGNTSQVGQSGRNNAVNCEDNGVYEWYVDGNLVMTPTRNLTYTFTTVGMHSIRLVAVNDPCSDEITKWICIEEPIIPNFKINGQDSIRGCAPLTLNINNLTSINTGYSCRPYKYEWSVRYNPSTLQAIKGVDYTLSPNDSAINPVIVFLKPGKYYVRLTITNACGPIFKDVPVDITDIAGVDFVMPAVNYCGLRTINFATDNNHKPTYNSNSGAETYQWSITGGSYTFVGGTTATSAYPQIQFNDYVTYAIKLTFANSCGTKADSQYIRFDSGVTASANNDTSFCYDVIGMQLNGVYTGNISTVYWQTILGSGTFSNPNILNPFYTLSTLDKINGTIRLRYYVYPSTGSACPIATDDVVIVMKPDNYITSADSDTICSNTKVAYTPVSSLSNSIFNWTSTVISGTVSGNTPSGSGSISDSLINTSSANAVVKYTITPTANGCYGQVFNLFVTVIPRPNLMVAVGADTLCSNTQTAIHASSSNANAMFSWSAALLTGSASGFSSKPIPDTSKHIAQTLSNSGVTNAVVQYIITSSAGEGTLCAGETDTILIVVRPTATIANAGSDQLLCNQTSVTLFANQASIGAGTWQQVGGPAVTFVNANAANAVVNNLLPNSTYTFVWKIVAPGNCSTNSDTVIITNRPAPTTANAGPDRLVCNFTSTTDSISILGNNPAFTFESGRWAIIGTPVGSNAAITLPDSASTFLVFDLPGTYTLTYRIINDAGCLASMDTMVVNIYEQPNAGVVTPADSSICIGQSITMHVGAVTGNIVKWQYNPKPLNDNVWIDTLVVASSITFDNVMDSMLIRIIVESEGSANGCSIRDTSNAALIIVAPLSVGGQTAASDTVCYGSNTAPITLSGYRGQILRWESSVNSGLTWVSIANTSSTNIYTNLTTTTWFRVVVKSGVCSEAFSDTTIITVLGVVSNALAGLDQVICTNTASLSANQPATGETGRWNQVAGPNTAVLSSSTNNTITASGLIGGTYQFVWTLSNAACPSTQDTISISVRPSVTPANAGADVLVCDFVNTSTLTLNGNTNPARSYETYGWSVLVKPAGSLISFSDSNNPASTFTFNAAGTYKLIWSITNDVGCAVTRDTISIFVFDKPVVGTVSGNTIICVGQDVAVSMSAYTGIVKKWQYNPAPIADNIWIDTLVSSSTINFLSVASDFAVRSIVVSPGTAAGCSSSDTSNALIVLATPGALPGSTGPSANYCSGGNGGTISLSGHLGSVVRWEYSTSNGVTWSAINDTTSTISYLNLTTTTWYRAVIQSGNCGNVASSATFITISQPVTQANAGSDQAVCTTSATLSANDAAIGENGAWTQLAGPSNATFASSNSAATSISALLPGTYLFVWTLSNIGCPATSDTVRINVSLPTVAGNTGNADTVCKGGNSGTIGLTGNTGRVLHWEFSEDNGASWNSILDTASNIYYNNIIVTTLFRAMVESGNCGAMPSAATKIMVMDSVSTPNAGADQNLCLVAAANLNANTPAANETGEWIQIAGTPATFSATNIANVRVTNLQAGRYLFVWAISNGMCAARKDTVSVVVNPELVNNIDTARKDICFGQPVTISGPAPTGGSGTYIYQWQQSVDGIQWSNISGQTGMNLTITPQADVYVRRAVNSMPCLTISDKTLVKVQAPVANNNVANSQAICFNTAASPLVGSMPAGASGSYSYQWQSSSNGVSWTDIQNAVGQNYNPGVLAATTMFRRNVVSGFCSAGNFSDSIVITVNPNALAEYTYSKDTSCPPFNIDSSIVSPVRYDDKNIQYQWFANGSMIGTSNSFPGYILNTSGDSVLITMVAVSKFGCVNDTVAHRFYALQKPEPAFSVSDSTGCGPMAVTFTNRTPNASLFSYKWRFGNGQTSTLVNPGNVVYIENPNYGDTTYKVSLTVYSDCDSITVYKDVLIKSRPKSVFNPDKTFGCTPLPVTFTNRSLGASDYTWDFGDGTVQNTTLATPVQHTYVSYVQDTFLVKLISRNGCGSDTQRYSIIVSPNRIQLYIAINGSEKAGCNPHAVNVMNNSAGATNFRWDFGDGNFLTTNKNIDTVKHTYTTAGNYVIKVQASNGCSDTLTTENVKVLGKPVVDFSATPLIACLGDTIKFTNQSDTITNALWQFGDGLNSNLNNPKHTYSAPGNYVVTLIGSRQYSTGNVCMDSAKKNITIIPSLPGAFSMSDSISACVPFTVTFTNLVQGTAPATWNFGDGKRDTGNVVTHTYVTTGNFVINMIAQSPGGCSYTANKSIRVNGPEGSWQYDNGIVCGSVPVRFKVTGSGTDSIKWNFGDGTSLITTSSVVYHTYTSSGRYVPSAELMAGIMCRSILPGTDTIKVEFTNAGFRTAMAKACGQTTVSFTDTSNTFSGVQQWMWNFGDGTTGNTRNPQHVYTANNNWPVTLITKSAWGCKDTITNPVNVIVNSTPIANIVSDTVACANQNVLYNSNIVSADPITFMYWNFTNGSTSNAPAVNNNYANAGNHLATLVVSTASGCSDTVTKPILISPSPVVRTNADKTICPGEYLQLNATGAATYSWSPIANNSCITCPNPIVNPSATTIYEVTGSNTYGCVGKDTVIVTVAQPFKMSVTPDVNICIGQSTQLQATGANFYMWSPTGGLNKTDTSSIIAAPASTTRYRVVGISAGNCFKDTAYVTVGVGQYPTVELGPDKVLAAGSQFPLNSLITNGPITKWEWTPAGNLNCNNCPLPVANIKTDIKYQVKVTNSFGCSASDTIAIKVFCENTQVFIPNLFTPDNDGINDVLMVRGSGIKLVKSFRIFNRWGEIVFEKSNFPPNEKSYGWDGTIRGAKAGAEVYVYTAEVMCENEVSFVYKGNVAIIK